jgi:hypothetical protein
VRRFLPGGAPRSGDARERASRGALSRRALVAAVLAAVGAAVAAPGSRADGDPASDYLLAQNVFFPYRAPSPAVSSALERVADDVYLRGDRVKVALIYDPDDLGSIPSLFGDASGYARFLGAELGLWYVGPLLVVMPAGFGVYDGGRSTAVEERVLQSIPVSAGSPDDLVRSATAALEDLAAADALSSPDVRAPLVTAHPATATRSQPATLRFDLFDDSGRSTAVVRVYEGGSLVSTLASPAGFAIGTRAASVRWPVPARLRSRRMRFCVVASDPAGNRSAPACAPFLRIR